MTAIVTHGTFAGLPVSKADAIPRAASPELDSILGWAFPVLDHGFIRVIDYMGNQDAVVQAARVSYGTGTRTSRDSRSLLRYLLRHAHTSPFEMCEIKLHVKLPIYVARQWIRHRTANVNEYSARYSLLAREFHIPEPGDLAPQSTDNKQGRSGGYDPVTAQQIISLILGAAEGAFDAYDEMIEEGGPNVARETARTVLPLSTYTEWYWKVDLHNLLHFLKLRMHPHAQLEIRKYADVMYALVESWVPHIAEAFEDYVLHAHTFSRAEMDVLRRLIAQQPISAEDRAALLEAGSGRELSAFTSALWPNL